MTDKNLANCEHNYGVWEMQEYKSSWVQPTHTVYIKEAVRDTLQSSTGVSCPLCCTPIDVVMRVYFWCVSGELSYDTFRIRLVILVIIVTADIAEQ